MQKITLSVVNRYKDVAYTELHEKIQEKLGEGWKRDEEPKDFATWNNGKKFYLVEQNMVK